MKLIVWTRGYRPFIMGGDVNAPIGTTVEVGDSFETGKGFRAFAVVSPDGQMHVAEATSGAIVGTSIEQVKGDIAKGDPAFMSEQVAKAMEMREKVFVMSEAEFWGLLSRRKTS